ncbi:melatonin receptor type 1B-B-like isoform X2 [Girardinichthys multiradiatus]|uniref:melatonin receptor type 1B-B-like isoform X2 n=1 Tax=Girardinichthys multiradiatus TaxID=208333 RepID=UPI001FAC83CF|nr:melatonin receptor type 1B-B-like isoform X2 [Girardinichthys multiradiatus]
MPDTLTLLKNRTEPRLGQLERSLPAEGTARPAWVIAILASVLIFTTVVDVLGNLLVIISVFRNRKLRNAVRQGRDSRLEEDREEGSREKTERKTSGQERKKKKKTD